MQWKEEEEVRIERKDKRNHTTDVIIVQKGMRGMSFLFISGGVFEKVLWLPKGSFLFLSNLVRTFLACLIFPY